MAKKVLDVYITDNIEALEITAVSKQDFFLNKKSDKLMNVATKLYKDFCQNQNDRERAYILGRRYILVLNQMFKTCDDPKYMEARYKTEYEKVKATVASLREDLEKCYADIQAQHIKVVKEPEPEPVVQTKTKGLFEITGNFITCKDLYSALNNNEVNILLVDTRLEDEYSQSKICFHNCINVPDDKIKPGLSANTLGQTLAKETQAYWNKRDLYDVIVLSDWNSNSENIFSSKLEKLRSCIVEWDFNRNYKQEPVYLSGGFKEFLDTYPQNVTNAHVYLVRKNDELDELLDIDNVTYPLDNEQNSQIEYTIGLDNKSEAGDASKEGISELIKETINDVEPVLDYPEIENKDEPAEPPKIEPVIPVIPEKPVNKAKVEDEEEIKNAVEANRLKILNDARSRKPKPSPSPDNRNVSVIMPPTINRNIKPDYKDKISGRVGMKNIRNTCYMNTTLQCIRALPVIKSLFLKGIYKKKITRDDPALIYELAGVVENLWLKDNTFIIPDEFYNKVCELEPMYRKGNHEDCMEFFLFLFSHLNEDCSHEMKRPDVLTPKLEAKICQLLGKTSVFVELFYHQSRIQKLCKYCNTSCYSFETDNTLMLPIPEYSCNLIDLVDDYFKEYCIHNFCCTKCKKQVFNKKEVVENPTILAIVLKRGNQMFESGSHILMKNDINVYFDEYLRFGKYKYRLFSIAMHQGTLRSGHYTAGCYIHNEWYEMNDEIVRKLKINSDAVRSRVCALFYVKEGAY